MTLKYVDPGIIATSATLSDTRTAHSSGGSSSSSSSVRFGEAHRRNRPCGTGGGVCFAHVPALLTMKVIHGSAGSLPGYRRFPKVILGAGLGYTKRSNKWLRIHACFGSLGWGFGAVLFAHCRSSLVHHRNQSDSLSNQTRAGKIIGIIISFVHMIIHSSGFRTCSVFQSRILLVFGRAVSGQLVGAVIRACGLTRNDTRSCFLRNGAEASAERSLSSSCHIGIEIPLKEGYSSPCFYIDDDTGFDTSIIPFTEYAPRDESVLCLRATGVVF